MHQTLLIICGKIKIIISSFSWVLGAVSPAVVVPSLLWLKSEGYGENKGISTLVTAGTLLDNIFAITMFGVFLSIIFSQGKNANDSITQFYTSCTFYPDSPSINLQDPSPQLYCKVP